MIWPKIHFWNTYHAYFNNTFCHQSHCLCIYLYFCFLIKLMHPYAYCLHTIFPSNAYHLPTIIIMWGKNRGLCLPKNKSQMNYCIVNVVEKSVFVAFKQIVEKGSIELWDIEEDGQQITKKDVFNTNFENLELKLKRGKYKLEITMDGQQITKTININ